MPMKVTADESRTPEQLEEHYEIEKELAHRLRTATREERRQLYASLYDELFRRVPHHPQLTRKADPRARRESVSTQLRLLRRFFTRDSAVLEVGPGDCSLSFEVAKHVRHVYAVDVSREITRSARQPRNVSLIISDGCSIPVPTGSLDVAYSNQLMEHLHPDDAREQLANIHEVLTPGGVYVCITPSRYTGPHDISKYFSHTPTGFHLKEYTTTELIGMFRAAGFSRFRVFSSRRMPLVVPASPVVWMERILDRLPLASRRRVAGWAPVRMWLSVLAARKESRASGPRNGPGRVSESGH
jgi:SAM-dependent methyltransferase